MAGFSMDNLSDTDFRVYHPAYIVSSGVMAGTVPSAIAGPNGSPPSIDTSYAICAKLGTTRFNTNPITRTCESNQLL